MNDTFRVIIAGGRDFDDYDYLNRSLDHLLSKTKRRIVIISGVARGADTLGEKYAREKGYEIRKYPADWSLGKSAGYIRNLEMAQNADALVTFWDGKSYGTKHMIKTSQKHGLQVRVKKYEKKL